MTGIIPIYLRKVDNLRTKNMTEQRYNALYLKKVELSNNYLNLRPIISMLKEFCGNLADGEEDALIYIKKIESDLYEHNVVPFKVESIEDLIKLEQLPDSEGKTALRYVYYALKVKESGIQVNENKR